METFPEHFSEIASMRIRISLVGFINQEGFSPMRHLPFLVAAFMILSCGVAGAQGADECANAQPIVLSAPGTVTVQIDNTAATDSAGLPAPVTCPGTFLGDVAADVWFSWTAPDTGLLTLSTCTNPGALDTDIVLYDLSGGCAALIELGCDGDGTGCASFGSNLVGAGVFAGVTYGIRVGGWDPASIGTTDMDVTFELGTIAPDNMVCTYDSGTDTATLNWDNLDQYDTLNYYINGTLTGTFDGTAGAASDTLTGFAPGSTIICLEGVIGGLASTQTCCSIYVAEPCPATVAGSMVPYAAGTQLIGCVACQAGGLHADNSYLRSFDLVNGYGISDELTVECVTTTADSTPDPTLGTQPVRIRLIIDTNGGGPQNFTYTAGTNVGQTPDPGNTTMLMVYEEEFQVPALANVPAYNFILGTGVIDPDGLGANNSTLQCMTAYGPSASLAVEIFTPDGQGAGHAWFMNSTDATVENGVSYIVAIPCGLATPSPLSGIGFPDNRYVLDVGYSVAAAGTCGSAGGIASLQCAQNTGDQTWNLSWSDAGGAASWVVEVDGNVEATLPSTDLSFTTSAQFEYQDVEVQIFA